METVEIDGTEERLRQILRTSIGKKLVFANGCIVWLTEEEGLFWGTNPYGLDWACSVRHDWLEKVLAWVDYWSQPRDESGDLINKI